MESKIVGKLNSVDYDPDFFESEPYPIPYIDNKKLKIVFVEAKHQPYLLKADQVLLNFIKLNTKDRVCDSQIVYNYYEEILKTGYTKPLDIKTTDEVWRFVYPSEIIVLWDEEGDFYLCLSCGCEWEKEHGLQLIFKDGLNLTRASGHDGGFFD